MKNLGSHFVFTRSQQNGIFILVAIIIVLQVMYFFLPFSPEARNHPEEQKIVDQIQTSIDSLKAVAASQDSVSPASFNPNFISDYKGYRLGMSIEEIDRLHEFRKQDRWINSPEQFQEVTKVSDSLLDKMAPLFQFPEFTQRNSAAKTGSKAQLSEPLSKADLNNATAEELEKVYGVGPKLSERIVKYRKSLNGFRGEAQLQDVYGLSPEVIERILQKFEVKNLTGEKIGVNSASIMQLVEIPYLNYEHARAIVKLREETGGIMDLKELGQIKDFPIEKIDRINLYLAIDQKN